MTNDLWSAVDAHLVSAFLPADPTLGAAGADPCLDGTAVQTVGSKGYDGFALRVVGPDA